MAIITLAVIPNGLTGVIGVQVLTPLNREKQVLYSVIVGALSDFILNLIMIPLWGAAGAALATTIAEFLVLWVQVILARDLLANVKQEVHILKYVIVTLIAAIPTVIVMQFLRDHSFINLVITSIVFFGIYVVELYIMKDELLNKILDNKITWKLIRK